MGNLPSTGSRHSGFVTGRIGAGETPRSQDGTYQLGTVSLPDRFARF